MVKTNNKINFYTKLFDLNLSRNVYLSNVFRLYYINLPPTISLYILNNDNVRKYHRKKIKEKTEILYNTHIT